ncbi:hypothetical protein [Bradyrhizobium australafricanum]|uniref:hypothetical protein n=1 Tax=Bradyrhizobium australafricanum TaxID=2821406 RepID=UPI001CE27C8F|nr:hypothetical protein [Bradyrhizobium australafricanum]MCA6098172.1 hypothetical protein [Bradyrhizobium australafricanum]
MDHLVGLTLRLADNTSPFAWDRARNHPMQVCISQAKNESFDEKPLSSYRSGNFSTSAAHREPKVTDREISAGVKDVSSG